MDLQDFIMKRLPVNFTGDYNYFIDKYDMR